jgi:hypothetical protein
MSGFPTLTGLSLDFRRRSRKFKSQLRFVCQEFWNSSASEASCRSQLSQPIIGRGWKRLLGGIVAQAKITGWTIVAAGPARLAHRPARASAP